jgi:hypothetical protein
MRHAKYLVALVFILCSLSACKKYLNEEVFSSSQSTNFYMNEQQGISALNGVYAGLRDTYFTYANDYTFFSMLEAPTGTVSFSPGFETMNYSAKDLADIKKVWDRMWVCVNRASMLIKLLKKEDINEISYKRIIAETKFLRSLCYFNLVRMWGDIPLNDGVETIADAYPAKVRQSLVYKQIIKDLESAAVDLPTWKQYAAYGNSGTGNLLNDYKGYERGRATKGAAQALLAKVYLTIASSIGSNANLYDNAFDKNEMYTKARDLCASVYTGGHDYSLIPEYVDIFKEVNENGKEDIFSIKFIEASDLKLGNSLAGMTAVKGLGILTTEVGTLKSTSAFLSEFTVSDKRRAATFFLEYINKSNVRVVYPSGIKPLTFKKYWSDYQISADNIPMQPTTHVFKTSAADKGRFGDDIPVLRYSDLLLMYAESLNALGDIANAKERVADVRDRAGLGRVLPVGSLTDLIIAERRRELCFEIQLWFDYQRLNIVQRYSPTLADVKYKYFPIPVSDLLMNPGLLPQNPGW